MTNPARPPVPPPAGEQVAATEPAASRARASLAPRSAVASSPLLVPSLQNYASPAVNPARLPWKLGPQVFVAFFGGVLAVAAFAFLNARRLGLTRDRLALLVAGSVVAFIAVLAASYALLAVPLPSALGSTSSVITLTGRAIALLLYLGLYWLQRPADRRHAFWGGEYASPWAAGIAAVFGLGLAQSLIVNFVVHLL